MAAAFRAPRNDSCPPLGRRERQPQVSLFPASDAQTIDLIEFIDFTRLTHCFINSLPA
jgi:hypothetical protein